MRIEDIYGLYKLSYKVVKDTREDVKNALYFSLKGESFNGNKYALEAVKNGANYAIIDEAQYKVDDRLILVDDALLCLQQLARYHRAQLNIPILALTGSNGKTTTKELINVVLNKKFKCLSTKGNLNNHIGVPLTLLSMTPEYNFGVVEMGANHQLEIEALCEIAQPDFGYITNFGRVHLEGFGSFEGVIKGKTEMYKHLKDADKIVFVNQEDPIQMEKSSGINRTVFGGEGADCNVAFTDADPFVSISFEGIEINSKLIGAYNFANIAAAVCIGNYFGIPAPEIKDAIEGFTPNNNRSQIIQRASNKVIMDAYNANPNSMDAAISNLASLSDHKKVAILGDMFELGDDAILEHQKIVDQLSAIDLVAVYLVGETFYKTNRLNSNMHKFRSFEEFVKLFEGNSYTDTTFLIKASRGMALERTLDYI
ncbi:UDP-N-acetylmuramoyl-tripeptide--D-alanyl-D-alanine ligase [Lutimonas halocynthiae]|uniref:UDP-N-acetylmuramoyl-tripeptide--D-alanyl-D- alanine ligase n=1 Tax=Lutimonas halocynthiae TaxID=1446477 RepID=UPI0025B4D4E1|nr:UDP-N-acetylmuramoyl-tripeptide--D-alanyl-D-alanine ligase [Lutimonas halocynthiae]MDN3643427.1 UDP-N-acetylmuramoyl-tripeptide--D-alanyl-D-alanine ligase [Lutimonas halocynthiae]